MTHSDRYWNLAFFLGGFAAFVAAVVLAWNRLVGWSDLAIMAVMYVATCLGVTVGYHRLLTHRAFKTYRPVKYVLAILGSMAVQGPVIRWVADHRQHHSRSDREGDPHSPHVGHSGGVLGSLKGLWYAHLGWMIRARNDSQAWRYCRDLMRDPGLRVIDRAFGLFVVLTFVVPFLLGYALTGTLKGGLTALLWGGMVRVFLLHHATFSINSICHFFGRQRFAVPDESRNVFWLSLLTMGESWHHNHHAFPRSFSHGLRWWELDPSAWLIRAMRRVGLVWDVFEVPREKQVARALAAQRSSTASG